MIDAQLGPPPVAASRGGSAPAGGAGGDSATGTLVESDDGSFVAVLDGHTAPDSPDATGTTQTPPAAGPLTGELPTEADADVAGPPPVTVPTDAAAIAAALAGAVAAAVQPAQAAAAPTAASPAPVATTTTPPIPGLVPAALDAQGRIVPVPPQATPVDPEVPVAQTGPAGAQTGTAGGAPAAASVTLTLKPAEAVAQAAVPAPAAAPVDADGAPAVAVAGAPATVAPGAEPEVANWHSAARPIGTDVPASAAKAPEPPAGLALGQPVQAATSLDAPGGLGRPAGPTTPHELARELGTRLQMAVREGGRELVVTLRPAELGQLTIRVTMQDGVLQAQILADRPEAARMLQQSLSHLGSALGDLGYSLENLDVAYGGDPRDAQASAGDAGAPVRGEVLEADGTPVAASVPTTAVAGTPARLDLLA